MAGGGSLQHTCSWHGRLSAPTSWQLCVTSLQGFTKQERFYKDVRIGDTLSLSQLKIFSRALFNAREERHIRKQQTCNAREKKKAKRRWEPAYCAIPVCSGRGVQSFTAPCDFSDNSFTAGLLPIPDADAVLILWRNRIHGNSHH